MRLALPSGLVVETVVATRFALDGGAMFGVVPRPVWERVMPPDSRHRIPLVARVLLVNDAAARRLILVDCGLGDRFAAKDADRFAISAADGIGRALAERGLTEESVTDVVLTHLHWDHAGGAVRADGTLRFPRAHHHLSRAHLDDMATLTAKDAGSFWLADRGVLEQSGTLVVHEEFGEWLPGVHAERCDGHAGGLAIVRVGAANAPQVVFPADLIPTHAHVHLAWGMAYDNEPRRVSREKEVLLRAAAARGDVVVFEHDPHVEAATISREGDGFRAVPLAR